MGKFIKLFDHWNPISPSFFSGEFRTQGNMLRHRLHHQTRALNKRLTCRVHKSPPKMLITEQNGLCRILIPSWKSTFCPSPPLRVRFLRRDFWLYDPFHPTVQSVPQTSNDSKAFSHFNYLSFYYISKWKFALLNMKKYKTETYQSSEIFVSFYEYGKCVYLYGP